MVSIASYVAIENLLFVILIAFALSHRRHTGESGTVKMLPDSSKELVIDWYSRCLQQRPRSKYAILEDLPKMLGFGLHDDSFAYSTLDGEDNGDVYNELRTRGRDIQREEVWSIFGKLPRWEDQTRPELQDIVFEPDYPAGSYQQTRFHEMCRRDSCDSK